jgi:hypothetical protein
MNLVSRTLRSECWTKESLRQMIRDNYSGARLTRPEPGTFLRSRDPADLHPAGAILASSIRGRGHGAG